MKVEVAEPGAARVAVLERGNASGRATRDLLIRTAERLFAERGIGAVSFREIGQAAGQRNNAATKYHFRTRQDLIDSIYIYRAAQLNTRRLQLLKDLEAGGHLTDIEALLSAILRPFAESIADPEHHYLGFLARVLTDEARISVVAPERQSDVDVHLEGWNTLRKGVYACVPTLPPALFDERFDMVFRWAIHAMAEHARSTPLRDPSDIEVWFSCLVAMLASALRAGVH
jgi:AcrR family transcriptional regulator